MNENKKIESEFYDYLNDFAKSNGIRVTEIIKMDKLVEDLRNLYRSKKDKEKGKDKDPN